MDILRMSLRHRAIHAPCSVLLVPSLELIFLQIGKTRQMIKGFWFIYNNSNYYPVHWLSYTTQLVIYLVSSPGWQFLYESERGIKWWARPFSDPKPWIFFWQGRTWGTYRSAQRSTQGGKQAIFPIYPLWSNIIVTWTVKHMHFP